MQSLTRQPRQDPRAELKQINRSKPSVYGEAHLIMGVRDTIAEFLIEQDGSGVFKVTRTGLEIAHVEWKAERSLMVNLDKLTQDEKETL